LEFLLYLLLSIYPVRCQVQDCFVFLLSSNDYTTSSNTRRGVVDGGKAGEEEAGEQ